MLALLLTTLVLTPPSGNALLLASHSPHGTDDSHRQMQCIMQQLQLPYQTLAMPWRRAKQEVKHNRIDGYYTAMASEEMRDTAVLSAPLFLENWYWFWHQRNAGPDNGAKLRYGAVLGSHQADWLRSNDITAEIEVSNIAQLLQLLHIGRIDAFIADLEDFDQARVRLKLPAEDFQQRFLRYAALGVYFSAQRLQQHPGLIRQFNAAAYLCATRSFALSDIEQRQISDLMLEHVRSLAKSAALRQAVIRQNQAAMSIAQVQQADFAWQQQLAQPNSVPTLAKTLLQHPASAALQHWQANYQTLVNEVILMDNQGANVAISRLTSDYWQGDETQFLSVFEQPLDYYIELVEYDQSTGRFQVKLSVPVLDEAGVHIGALSIGIDVERALTATD
ncbi:MAG: transporter substrate-binding domain-containing protein [Gammaproteobacteria bacterium]|nr:transporter substrate-binding domain-containing protein [Gammaproteobacteria bacterium]MBU1555682.1 transporter substrate-binding domain-containing protein [Gammaproteobacteria bacterium]MBU2072174.1 transporter substrate-binding domain-containing protein [Gammaproteobacteria bacterium]MBU2182036.1 transporter substrate-binding domain-containing protein [Gammaproteobacteria bacterium]MBU2203879.1 transporter substrate-binding domain-containing protein [Gammaproteobacteria bacterium]